MTEQSTTEQGRTEQGRTEPATTEPARTEQAHSPHLLRRTDIEALPERRHVHQFNPNAVRMTRSISELLGLTRVGVHLIRLEPGRDSTQFHSHDRDEEFVYVLSGRGVADIGDARHEVGPGDFMAFPERSAPHRPIQSPAMERSTASRMWSSLTPAGRVTPSAAEGNAIPSSAVR